MITSAAPQETETDQMRGETAAVRESSADDSITGKCMRRCSPNTPPVMWCPLASTKRMGDVQCRSADCGNRPSLRITGYEHPVSISATASNVAASLSKRTGKRNVVRGMREGDSNSCVLLSEDQKRCSKRGDSANSLTPSKGKTCGTADDGDETANTDSRTAQGPCPGGAGRPQASLLGGPLAGCGRRLRTTPVTRVSMRTTEWL